MRALPIAFAFAIVASYGNAASPEDFHLQRDPESALYAASAFAHGFRHGYEEGFHSADRDLHLSRFSLSELKPLHMPKASGYQAGFGSKDRFSKGFEIGFRAGYTDSAESRDFRAISAQVPALTAQDRDFDSGVEVGAMTNLECRVSMSRSYCAGLHIGRELAGHPQPASDPEIASAATSQK